MSPRRTTTAHRTNTSPQESTPQPIPLRHHHTKSNKPTAQTTLWNFIQLQTPTPTNRQINDPQHTHATQTGTTTQPDEQTRNEWQDATSATQATMNLNTPTSTPVPISGAETITETTTTEPQQTTLQETISESVPRHNHPWGDTWAMDQPHSWFRVLSKNTGTINLQNSDMEAITTEIINLGVSVFAIQETNNHWDTDATHQLYTQCRKTAPQIALSTSSSNDSTTPGYQPGGTVTLAMDPWTSRIIKRGNDPSLGRWSYLEFMGKSNKRLIVVSGYRVCNQKFDAASNTATAQQIRLLQAQGIQNPKPRRIFIDDLIAQINKWRNEHKEVLICMDANESIDDPKADISRLFTATDLVDLHHHRYPSIRKPATHQRGTNAIDVMAGSPLVVEALRNAWICPFATPAIIKGDHRLLGVDLDPEILFGNRSVSITKLQERGVNSHHELKCTKFCKQVVTKCLQSQLAERLKHLQMFERFSQQQCDELDQIDNQLTSILLQADRACGSNNTTPWSPTVNQAYLQHRMWSIALTAHRNHRDMDDIIAAIRAKLTPSEEDKLEKTRSTSANLRNAQKKLQKAKREADILRQQHLDALLNEARASNKKKKSKALTHLIRAEQNRRCYAAFRHHTKPRSQGGLAFITKHNGPTEPPTTIMEPDEMNETLLEYSRLHFSKAQGSPFTVEPLSNLLQYDGLTVFGNQILKGRSTLDNVNLQPPTKALLTNMRDKTVDPEADDTQSSTRSYKKESRSGRKKPQHCHLADISGFINPYSDTRSARKNNPSHPLMCHPHCSNKAETYYTSYLTS